MDDRGFRIQLSGAGQSLGAIFSVGQLKTIQVVIELIVFTGFVRLYMKESITWNYLVGFMFLFLGAFFIFAEWR